MHRLAHEEDAEATHQERHHEAREAVVEPQVPDQQVERDHLHRERDEQGRQEHQEQQAPAREAALGEHVARERAEEQVAERHRGHRDEAVGVELDERQVRRRDHVVELGRVGRPEGRDAGHARLALRDSDVVNIQTKGMMNTSAPAMRIGVGAQLPARAPAHAARVSMSDRLRSAASRRNRVIAGRSRHETVVVWSRRRNRP